METARQRIDVTELKLLTLIKRLGSPGLNTESLDNSAFYVRVWQ